MKNKKVSVILPVHDVSGDFDVWFKKAIESVVQSVVKPTTLMVVCADNKDVKIYMDSWEKPEDLNITITYNDGKTDYCGQVNFGVANCDTEYFSILEYDDEYSNIWFKNFDDYVLHYPDVDMFLPLVVDTDEQGQFVGFTNEALWAMGFSEEQGFLDNNTLLKFQNFQVSGLIMSGLKSSIRLTFNYEFLLRASYNDTVIMTIPKVGYKHTNQRTNSLFWDYKNSTNNILSQEEAKFWVDTAKKEYFFTSDREVSFNS